MNKINLFCFGFGQVAKDFVNILVKNKLKNPITLKKDIKRVS